MANTDIINDEGLFLDEIPDVEKTLQDWKDTYFRLRAIDPTFTRKELKAYNKEYFDKATSSTDMANLHRKGSISYDRVKTIVKAVRKHIVETQKTTINPSIIRSRQRLIPS